MKHLANIISFSRIIMAPSLFWFINNKYIFIAIYTLCWITDAVDGKVARATHSESELGSKIDDVADTTLIIVMGIIMIIWIKAEALIFIPLIVAVIIIRLINIMITKYKYKNVCIIHTYGAKFLGKLVFLMPIVYLVFNYLYFVSIVLIFAILVSLEESFIHLTSEEYNPEKKSLFIKKKTNT